MSHLTAEGRRKIRDYQRDFVVRQIGSDPTLRGLPGHQRVTLAELKLVGRSLYADIKRRGVMLPDGTVNPAVEAQRKNAHEQLYSLQVFMELNRTQSSESRDLVADMARAIETPAADVAESAPAAADGAGTARDEPAYIEPER